MQYQNCIFDLYGTLVDIRTDEEKDGLWEKLALFYGYYGAAYTKEELRAAYGAAVLAQEERLKQEGTAQYIEIKLESVFLQLFTEKQVEADEALAVYAGQFFRVLSTEYERLYPGVKDLLAALRAARKRVILLSNAQRIFTGYELRLLGLCGYFDAVYLSSDYGVRKPDRRFFKAMLEQEGLGGEACIMIGNDPFCDAAGAKAAGMAAVFLPSNLSPESTEPVLADYVVEKMDMEALKHILLQGDKRPRQTQE